MRARRSAPATPAGFVWSAWLWIALIALVASQLVTFFLLVSLTNKKIYPQDCLQQPSLDLAERQAACEALTSNHSSRDRVLSVHPTSTIKACEPRVISAGRCRDEGRFQRPEELRLRTCEHSLVQTDIVFGVWHSLATEGRLQPLLDTWGQAARVVLLASSVGVRESKLFREGALGSQHHLLDTGVEQDDYFSTLGKAFIGLRLMLEAYPDAKWFVVLGDDNYVLLGNYLNALSAFNPNEPWALSRMVHRNKFGCKVAGGASVITSRAMTQALAPHLEPWYQGILDRSGGDVNRASEADKFHDIAFQKLVESIGHSWVHLDELPHEPPGFLLHTRLGVPTMDIPGKSALFHYVPGGYMYYLHFTSSQACTCALGPQDGVLGQVAVGVYSSSRRLSKLDEKRIASTWGKDVPQRVNLASSGKDFMGLKGDVARLHELADAFPKAGWLLLLPVDHYLVAANLAARIRKLDADSSAGRGVMVHGPLVNHNRRGAAVDYTNTETYLGEGSLLVGRDLTSTIFRFEAGLLGGLYPFAIGPNDRGIEAWARTLSIMTVLEDAGFVRQYFLPNAGHQASMDWQEGMGCPATFPMDPDLSGLKPEFTLSEGEAVMPVTRYLLRATSDWECEADLHHQRH